MITDCWSSTVDWSWTADRWSLSDDGLVIHGRLVVIDLHRLVDGTHIHTSEMVKTAGIARGGLQIFTSELSPKFTSVKRMNSGFTESTHCTGKGRGSVTCVISNGHF